MSIKSTWARQCLISVFGILLMGALAACGGGGGGGGSGSSAIASIDSSRSAENAAKDIAEICRQVRGLLINGTYSGEIVNGNSGTASVTGTVHFESGISCGSDCVRSENDTAITIVFNDYAVNTSSNTTTTISGSIDYTDDTFTQQTAFGFSSAGSISVVSNTNVSYEFIGTDAAGTFGTRDTITFIGSSGSGFDDQSGTLMTASGTFNF